MNSENLVIEAARDGLVYLPIGGARQDPRYMTSVLSESFHVD